MDFQNLVTEQDTETLDAEITALSISFAETHYFNNEQEEELEMLVAKAMKLGELYERKKWQAAKAQVIPETFVLVPKEPTQKQREAGGFVVMSGGHFTEVYKAMIGVREQSHYRNYEEKCNHDPYRNKDGGFSCMNCGNSTNTQEQTDDLH